MKTAELQLRGGLTALIDSDDVSRVNAFGRRWRVIKVAGQTYAAHTHLHPNRMLLHRFILGATPGTLVMHRNGNGLDCRKINLKFGDQAQNGASHRRKPQGLSSRFRGVCRKRIGKRKPWEAGLISRGKRVYLGTFETEEQAARAYNEAALLYFGENASLNQI